METTKYACGCKTRGRETPCLCPVHGEPAVKVKPASDRLKL